MKKFVLALALTTMSAICVTAQTDDYKKGEFFVGFSNGQVDTGFDPDPSGIIRDRSSFNGFNASGVYNFSRYVGAKADVSGTYNSTRFSFPVTTGGVTQTVTFDSKNSLYNVVGGIQVKDNASNNRFKPFVHGMAGLGNARVKVKNLTCTTTPSINCGEIGDASESGFSVVGGGGLDIRLSDRVDFRAFQVDYNPIWLGEGSGRSDNFRFGIGIVIK